MARLQRETPVWQRGSLSHIADTLLPLADNRHFVEVAIGTPPQKFHIGLDTASYELGVVSTSCLEQCDISPKFNTSTSSTYLGSDKFIGMGYGSGSVQGKVGTDIVSLGGYTNPAQAFAVLSKSDPGMIGAFLPGEPSTLFRDKHTTDVCSFKRLRHHGNVNHERIVSVDWQRASWYALLAGSGTVTPDSTATLHSQACASEV